jgi:hypothetical protein
MRGSGRVGKLVAGWDSRPAWPRIIVVGLRHVWATGVRVPVTILPVLNAWPQHLPWRGYEVSHGWQSTSTDDRVLVGPRPLVGRAAQHMHEQFHFASCTQPEG